MTKGTKRDKISAKFWEGRLYKPTYRTKDGRTVENPDWYVTLCFRGEEHKIFLQTMDKKLAAERALEAYFLLRASGWGAVFEKFGVRRKQTSEAGKVSIPEKITVGKFIGLIRRRGGLAKKTMKMYSDAMYRILEEAFGLNFGTQKYDYVHGGNLARLESLDALELSKITPELLEGWRSKSLERRINEGFDRESAITTLNSILRSAKSLFAKKNLRAIGMENFGSPFLEIKFWREKSHRYVTTFSAHDLVRKAYNELRGKEEYKIFLLAIGCGLRRDEVDKLMWSQLDFDNSSIHIYKTDYIDPKTRESSSRVFMDDFIRDELLDLRKKATGKFVVESPCEWSAGKNGYRCRKDSKSLLAWLRKNGVPQRCAIHVLRKEFASQICNKHGIYAASRALRHSSCAVTEQFYADKAPSVSTGLFDSAGGGKKFA
ncbi:MAG: tyrosine-type recombinase/integrase [Puniceicoccales bacterium]|nr:tyrosine-type recombinase/integrase [Puniceicoccales bacterium]